MPDLKISASTDAGPLDGTEMIPIARTGSTAALHTDPQRILNLGTITTASAAVGSNADGVSIIQTAGAGDGSGLGAYIGMYGGVGGATGAGGAVFLSGGAGGATSGNGGQIGHQAGSATTQGDGGAAFQAAGNGAGTGNGGGATLAGGNSGSGATGAGGQALLRGGNATSANGNGGGILLLAGTGTGSGQGGDVSLTTGAGATAAQQGVVEVNGDASLMPVTFSWTPGVGINGRTILTATRKMRVTALIGRVDTANGVAASFTVSKAPSGTAFSAGTLLHTGSFNLAGTVNTNQTLALTATAADLLLAAGDSIGIVETGALGTAVGALTIHLGWQ